MDFAPSVYEHAAKIIDKTPWEVSRDAELLFQSHREAYLKYQHKPITVGIDIYNLEAEAYGAVVEKPDDTGVPSIQNHICSSVSDILALPDLDIVTSRISMIIEVGERLKKEFPQADVRIPVSGPVSITGTLVGMENLLIESAFNPESIKEAFEFLCKGQLNFCKAVADAGLDVTFFESAAAPPLFSPAQFKDMIAPVLTQLMQNIFKITQKPVALIIGGNTEPILESIIATGSKYVICPSETDQKAFMEKIWDCSDIMVRINMDPKIVAFGTWDEIKQEIDRVLQIVKGRDMVCLGSGVLPYETPVDNVLKIIEYMSTL